MTFGLSLLLPGMFLSSCGSLSNSLCRTLTALTFVESALVHSHTLNYYFIPFFPQLIFKLRPEIWRLFTPYLLTDPKLNVIFDLYFSMLQWWALVLPHVLMYVSVHIFQQT